MMRVYTHLWCERDCPLLALRVRNSVRSPEQRGLPGRTLARPRGAPHREPLLGLLRVRGDWLVRELGGLERERGEARKAVVGRSEHVVIGGVIGAVPPGSVRELSGALRWGQSGNWSVQGRGGKGGGQEGGGGAAGELYVCDPAFGGGRGGNEPLLEFVGAVR